MRKVLKNKDLSPGAGATLLPVEEAPAKKHKNI
jgi:hypothetical protein